MRDLGKTAAASKGFAGFDGFALKLTAIVGMTCNHVANVFAIQLPEPLMLVLFSLGGVTFPVMAFLLVEGYRHTSNVKKYALRLALFACVAQIPYSLLWGAVPNVLFTLLVGLGMLWLHDKTGRRPLFLLVLMLAALLTLPFDWGCIGVLLVFLFQVVREWEPKAGDSAARATALRGVFTAMLVPYLSIGLPPLLQLPDVLAGHAVAATAPAAAPTEEASRDLGQQAAEFAADTAQSMVPFSLDEFITADASSQGANTIAEAGLHASTWGNIGYAFVGFTIAALMLGCYNGQRGRSMKWFFYAYYPVHLLAIWLVKAFC